MKWLKTIALSALALLSAGAAFLIKALGDRAKRAEEDAKAQREALAHVTEAAQKLQNATSETALAGEKANAERKNLSDTPDGDLVDRANRLF
jgi:membrane protein involved in colicin uptake